MPEKIRIKVTVNGRAHDELVEPRQLALDFIRDSLALTGTHAGCEHGVCGACTVLIDGSPTRSCLMFAPQLDGVDVRTVESLGSPDGTFNALQQAFTDEHGLQCGYCTPGMLMAATALLERNPTPNRDEVKDALSGNLCRCTGYDNIVNAVIAASKA